jgi:hypothetical protein
VEDDWRPRLQRLASLGGGHEVLRRAAARALGELDAPAAASLLDAAMRLSLERWPPAMVVLPAMLRALEEDADLIPHVATLRQVAVLHEQEEVAVLFEQGEAVQAYHPDAAARADARLFSAPLGVLKSRARLTRDPDELTRLAAASNAAVIREVLRNPRLTEELVVRIAARRPARAEALEEIWRSPRWNVRPAVRRALAFNPYLPPDVGVKLAALLTQGDLAELAVDANVHPAVRELAQRLSGTSGR